MAESHTTLYYSHTENASWKNSVQFQIQYLTKTTLVEKANKLVLEGKMHNK